MQNTSIKHTKSPYLTSYPKTKSLFFYLCCYFTCLLGCTEAFGQTGEDYQRAFSSSYNDALDFLKENKVLIKKEISKYKAPLELLIPAVFPETVRYSGMKDHVETFTLNLLYVRFGPSYANFSIGRFQMKPSFIEELEQAVIKRKITRFYFITRFESTDEKEIRQERVNRLGSLAWQLRYLSCFQAVVAQRFDMDGFSEEKKIRFLAAAYNRGFQNNQAEIERWMYIKAFPYGRAHRGTQYAYADIAWHFRQHHFSASNITK